MRLVDAGVTVKDRILLHLLDHWGQVYRAEWPETLTQDGIAGVVGISRSHVAVTLPDLIRQEMVEARTERVKGRQRKVKVYNLTYKGGMTAGVMAQGLLRCELTAVEDGSEFELPLDGLIQVYRVHMLVALRLLDEANRVDLRAARDLVEGRAVPPVELTVEEAAAEEIAAAEGIGVVGSGEAVEVEAGAPQEPAELTQVKEPLPEPVGEAADAAGAALAEPTPPSTAPPGSWREVTPEVSSPPETTVAGEDQRGWIPQSSLGPIPGTGYWPQQAHWQQGPPHHRAPGQQQHWYAGQPGQGYRMAPYAQAPAYFWSPLRFGTGRRPDAFFVGTTLALGWFFLLGAVVFMGVDPVFCAALWAPLAVFGLVLSWYGLRSTWALGERREAWVAAALSAFAFLVAVVVAHAALGGVAIRDLGWACLFMGLPSLVLASGTGRSVGRRGAFALVVGPVLVASGMVMAVLDPEGLGETAAFPLLLIAGGAGWTLVGWVMLRRLEAGGATARVLAGGAIGLAVGALGGAASLASRGELTEWMALGIALWIGLAAYVAAVHLVPGLDRRRPDLRSTYGATAVVGASALLTAAAIFIMGGMAMVGALEVVIAAALVVMVAPDLARGGSAAYPLMALGVVAAVTSVFAALGGP